MINQVESYISTITNKNTKRAFDIVYRKLLEFSRKNNKRIEDLNSKDLESFLERYYFGKSETTVANAIVTIKRIFKAIGKKDSVKDLSIVNMRKIVDSKKEVFFTPYEMQLMIEELINAQDKALVLLVYLGFYDEDFETIRHIREKDIHSGYIEINNKKVPINKYTYDILCEAKEETTYSKYEDDGEFNLRFRNGYLIRASLSPKTTEPYASPIILKKRFTSFQKYLNTQGFTPINVKNSKIIYDITKLELDVQNGLEMNQVSIKSYLQDEEKKCCAERINISKKNIKDKMIEDILKKRDLICQL